MTRQKKIEKDMYIEAILWLMIKEIQAFDYWLDDWVFYSCSITCQCSIHKVKQIFFKKIYPTKEFKNFEY